MTDDTEPPFHELNDWLRCPHCDSDDTIWMLGDGDLVLQCENDDCTAPDEPFGAEDFRYFARSNQSDPDPSLPGTWPNPVRSTNPDHD